MNTSEQNDFILRAYAAAGADTASISVYDLVSSISRLGEAENISYAELPLESRRECATAYLHRNGMIRRDGRGWMVTPVGLDRLDEIARERERQAATSGAAAAG
jgi:hypothetical protein